jgi:hypothetical protein
MFEGRSKARARRSPLLQRSSSKSSSVETSCRVAAENPIHLQRKLQTAQNSTRLFVKGATNLTMAARLAKRARKQTPHLLH